MPVVAVAGIHIVVVERLQRRDVVVVVDVVMQLVELLAELLVLEPELVARPALNPAQEVVVAHQS